MEGRQESRSGRGRGAEGRRQKAEGRKKKAEEAEGKREGRKEQMGTEGEEGEEFTRLTFSFTSQALLLVPPLPHLYRPKNLRRVEMLVALVLEGKTPGRNKNIEFHQATGI
jgi:hypothetical protein